MGFGDKLKGLKDQAQQAVAENKEKIQGAVQVAGDVANTKTHGKYATKIAKVGEKVESSVDRFAEGENPDAPAASVTHEPASPPTAAPTSFDSHAEVSEPPAFEPHAEEPAPAPAEAPTHSAPDFE